MKEFIYLMTIFLFLISCSSPEKKDFNEASKKNTIEAYENYLQNYPDSKFIVEVKNRIKLLEFEKAVKKNTIEAIEEYIQKYPESDSTEKAMVILEQLVWEKTEEKNTIKVFEDFLQNYPNSNFITEVEKLLGKKGMGLKKVNGRWKSYYIMPVLEKKFVDISQVNTSYNAFGQPDVSFSKNGYPILEYFWDGSFFKYKMANFYIKNIGSDGKCELIISEGKNTKRFNLKADKSYIIRMKPWNIDRYSDGFVIPKKNKLEIKNPGNYDVLLEELPKVNNVDLSNLPDKRWFNNTIWEYKKKYCMKVVTYIKLRSDGLFGHNDDKPEKFIFDGNETWKIENGYIYLDWNGGFANVKYKLTSKNTDCLFGTHSNSIAPYMLQRIN